MTEEEQNSNKIIVLAILNSLCNTSYDDIIKIEDNGINYIFHVNNPNPPHGFPHSELKGISKEYFDEAIAVANEALGFTTGLTEEDESDNEEVSNLSI